MALMVMKHFYDPIVETELKGVFRREGFEVAAELLPTRDATGRFALLANVYFATGREADAAFRRFDGFVRNIPPLSVELISIPDYLDHQSTLQIPITNREAVDIADCMIMKCENLINQYSEKHQSDDIMKLLTRNEIPSPSSQIQHEQFVRLMLCNAINNNSISQIETGKLFAQLLSKRALSMAAITHGTYALFNKWSDHLIKHPKLFSSITTIIVPLLVSRSAKYNFINLKDACNSISGTAITSIIILKILKNILCSKETQTADNNIGGIVWVYRKWITSDYVSMDTFMTVPLMNKCFKNDRVGIFLLSMILFDKMLQTDIEVVYVNMHDWIDANISAEIIKLPHFIRALTISTILVCSKSFDMSITNEHIKLIKWYTHSLPDQDIVTREVQCFYGVQIMLAVYGYPEGAAQKLFTALNKGGVINEESFDSWVADDSLDGFKYEDLKTKPKALSSIVFFNFSLSGVNKKPTETDY